MTKSSIPDLLGHHVRDRMTGFEGYVIGVSMFLTGCNQACVLPGQCDGLKAPDATWLDVQRLEQTNKFPRFELDNGETPGCDQTPPTAR